MNTASTLGPHAQTDRGACSSYGALSTLQKPLHYRRAHLNSCQVFMHVGLGPVVDRARVLVHEVLDCGAQAVVRGGVCGASQILLGRVGQAGARGAAQFLERGAQAVARGVARLASQVFDRGA
jgi:hypothetical protein